MPRKRNLLNTQNIRYGNRETLCSSKIHGKTLFVGWSQIRFQNLCPHVWNRPSKIIYVQLRISSFGNLTISITNECKFRSIMYAFD